MKGDLRMLYDDRERVLDIAEEFGLDITEDTVDDLMDKCAELHDTTKDRLVLPFDDDELVGMLKGALDVCVGV